MSENIPIYVPDRYKGSLGRIRHVLMKNIYTCTFISGLQKRKMNSYYRQYGQIPLFRQVAIETISRCNNDCAFCPVNIYNDKREFGIMDDDLYEKILRDLKSLNYKGVIFPFNNNEPLLDNKIAERIKLIREMLPEADIRLLTNGKLLNYNKFLELDESGLTHLGINNYNNRLILNPNILKLHNEITKSGIELKMKCRITFSPHSAHIDINHI